MDSSKVRLSPEEKILVTNREWILTKHRVIDKVYALFGEMSEQMKQIYLPPFSTGGLSEQPPKISKGERHLDMPWVTLDYPRIFSKEDVLAIRSFFWWGHYFSITLHLKGKWLRACKENIRVALADGSLHGFYVSCGGDEFDFDLHNAAYSTIDPQKPLQSSCLDGPFFKLSQKLPVDDLEAAGENMLGLFAMYVGLLKT